MFWLTRKPVMSASVLATVGALAGVWLAAYEPVDARPSQPLVGQEDIGLVGYIGPISRFIDLVGEYRVGDAMSNFKKESACHLPDAKWDGMKKLLVRLIEFQNYDGHEICEIRAVSEKVHEVRAVAIYKLSPVYYRFRFYQYQGEWTLQSLHVNNNLDELFENSEQVW